VEGEIEGEAIAVETIVEIATIDPNNRNTITIDTDCNFALK
jgi:hypothetical protein